MDANPTTDDTQSAASEDMEPAAPLEERAGWPEELCVLLRKHPRETWKSSPSPVVRFWLDKHDAFRQQGRILKSVADEFRAGKRSAADFGTWTAPRLQGFLGALHGHHQIEDFHYFPAFRAAEQRLAAGFDVLAKDHEQLHADIVASVETMNEFLSTIRAGDEGSADAQRAAGERYADAADALLRRLERHLDDEEDLIIPVMIDHGD